MNIALDTNGCYTTRAGTYRYIRGLLSGFDSLLCDSPCRIHPFAWEVENLEYKQPLRWLKTFYRDVIWSNAIAPIKLQQRDFDLYHDTASLPVNCPASIPRVSTFLDASALRYPERFRMWQRFMNPGRLRRTVEAEKVIAISRFSANEAMHYLGVPSSKIEVVYPGCDFSNPLRPVNEQPPVASIPGEFLLFVGSLEPVKNLALLHATWRQAISAGISLPPLVIVGSRWVGVSREDQPPPGWFYMGYQEDEVLVYLMRRAMALVFPSKYEGFGLPVLEAMALGCPVICSPLASLPEVGGNAAYFTENTPEAYLQSIRHVVESAGLRDELRSKGRCQAAAFSWGKCAEQTLAVYESCI